MIRNSNQVLLTILLLFFSQILWGFADFSDQKAGESVVAIKVQGILRNPVEINAVAITSNLLVTSKSAIAGLSKELSIDGNIVTVLQSKKEQKLALLSYPIGGLSPALVSKNLGEAGRNIYVVSHNAEFTSGLLVNSVSSVHSNLQMSMSKALLNINGSGIFNNCGELVGIYDQRIGDDIASGIGLFAITQLIEELSGTNLSLTDCPSEDQKKVIVEQARTVEREEAEAKAKEDLKRLEAEALARQKDAEKAIKIAEEQVKQQKKSAAQALSEANKESEENLAKAEAELEKAKEESMAAMDAAAAEKLALEEKTKAAIEAEQKAAAEALSEVRKEAEAEEEELKKILIMVGVTSLIVLLGLFFYFRRSKKNEAKADDEPTLMEIDPETSFDILIRGVSIGIKVPAELIIRSRGAVIGRSAAHSDFVIDAPEVSRSHLRLLEKDGIIYLEDLGSANGTILNGQKLQPTKPVSLNDGDQLEIAVSVFSVEFQKR